MKEELLSLVNGAVKRAIELGFDEAAVLSVYRESTMVKFANGEPSIVQSWSSNQMSIYVSKEKRLLGTSAPANSLEEAYRMLANLGRISAKMPPSILYAPLPEPMSIEPLSGLVDRKALEAVSDPSRASEVIVEAVQRRDIESFAGMLQISYSVKALATNTGSELAEDSTEVQAYVRAFAGEGSGQWAYGSRTLDLSKLEEMAETASDLAYRSRRQENISPGKYNILLSPMVAGNLLNYVAWMATGSSVLLGQSIFINKKPRDVVASEKLTLMDVPRQPQLPGSTAFDDEGIPTYDKPIIERGYLKTLLHNTKTAAKLGAKSTGNAGLVFPKVWALSVEPGEMSFEELLEEMGNGLVVTNNWYTRLQNYVEGIFSTITRDAAFIVRNGEIVGAARKFRIADTLPNLLRSISSLGKELYDIYWWEVEIPTRTPYILAKNIGTSKHTA